MGRKKREIVIREENVSEEDFKRQVREFEKQGFRVEGQWDPYSSGKRVRKSSTSGCMVPIVNLTALALSVAIVT